MKEEDRSGLTDDMPLPPQILVTTNAAFADGAEMRPRDIASAAHFRGDRLGKVENLDIKRSSDIDRRILMRRL